MQHETINQSINRPASDDDEHRRTPTTRAQHSRKISRLNHRAARRVARSLQTPRVALSRRFKIQTTARRRHHTAPPSPRPPTPSAVVVVAMDDGKFQNTMQSLNYGTVMEAAARDYMREKVAEDEARGARAAHRALDARDLAEVRARGGAIIRSCSPACVVAPVCRRCRRQGCFNRSINQHRVVKTLTEDEPLRD